MKHAYIIRVRSGIKENREEAERVKNIIELLQKKCDYAEVKYIGGGVTEWMFMLCEVDVTDKGGKMYDFVKLY